MVAHLTDQIRHAEVGEVDDEPVGRLREADDAAG
jgi:hypothetical protein